MKTLLKPRLQHKYFSKNFANFKRTLILRDTSGDWFWYLEKLSFRILILSKFVHLINIVSMLHPISRKIDLVFYDPLYYPVNKGTRNVRTIGVYKRTAIFGSICNHGKTSASQSLMNVLMRYVLRTPFSCPSSVFFSSWLRNFFIDVMCYQLEKIQNKNYKYKYQSIWNW